MHSYNVAEFESSQHHLLITTTGTAPPPVFVSH